MLVIQKIQKRPEETSPREFQMGQILHSSRSSKTYESSFRVSVSTLLFLLFLCSGTWLQLVGAISSTELPLNLNVNLEKGGKRAFPFEKGGDELGESERDVFPSSGVTDYPTSPESKFTSNGQFARSTLTAEKTTPSLPSPITPTPTPELSTQGKILVSSGNTKIIQSLTPTLTPGEILLQSESPLSPIVTIVSDNLKGKSNLGLEPSKSRSGEDAFNTFNTTSAHFPYTSMPTSSSEESRGKPTNINLLRKLWSSTRSSKLNLTHEHQSLLRIESEKSNTSGSGGGTGIGIGSTRDKSSIGNTRNGSRSLAGLLERESSSLPWVSSVPTSTTPSSGPLSPELTSLRPTSLKLGHEDDRAGSFPFSRGNHHHPTDILDAPETPPVHSISQVFNDGAELSTSIPHGLQNPNIQNGEDKDNKFPKPSSFSGGRRAPMLYPEWLSSGGVYPDDSTNGTGEYYGEPEYENLINNNENKGDGGGSGNPGEREEEAPGRRMQLRKRINAEFLGRVANLSWQNRLRLREQQVLRETERENRIAASLAIVSAEANAVSTEGPEAVMGQNGMADVISRGRIDSVMYVYFGDKYNDYHKEEIAGRVIQAVGGVIAAIAQVLTVLGAAKCVRKSTQSNQPPVHLHIGFALLISNLLLLLAVHATEPADVCATVAMILHYLHLVIGCWLFAYTVRTYLKLRRHAEAPNLVPSDSDDQTREVKRPIWSNNIRYCCASWSAPLPFIIMSYLVNPDGYETRHYCWMSIEKGMVVSFIVPVFILIGSNTFLVVLSLRHLLAQRKLWADSSSAETDEDSLDERKISSGIRASAMLLPLLAIMWFLGVVALENASSVFFQIAGASANIALSWLVLYFLGDELWPELWCCLAKRERSNSIFSMDDGCHGSVQPGAHLSFDNEPLLAASSTSILPLPSTSSAYGSDVGHLVCTSVSSSLSKSGHDMSAKLSLIPGPSRSGKRYSKSKRPNWSTPGGSEIYELKLDSISTICT